jgi:hypothetical protein
MSTTLKGPNSRYKRKPSSLLEAVRTAYPSSFKHLLKNFDRQSSFSTNRPDLGEALICLGCGDDDSVHSWGGFDDVLSVKESKYPIVLLRSKKLLMN